MCRCLSLCGIQTLSTQITALKIASGGPGKHWLCIRVPDVPCHIARPLCNVDTVDHNVEEVSASLYCLHGIGARIGLPFPLVP
jgi:hypothetical protein